MPKIAVVCIAVLFSVESYSQTVSALPNQIRASQTLDNINELTTGEVLYGIPQPEGKLIGDSYLYTNWLRGTIMLYEKDKLLEGYPLRYDVDLDELEIKGSRGVKVLRGDKVKSFVLIDSVTRNPQYFINAREFKNEENVTLMGFFQVVADGTKPLLKKTSITVKEGNYNVQFDVGSRDDKLLKKSKYFTSAGDRVMELPASNKKLLLLFDDQREDLAKFIKVNQLSAKNEHHLKAIFERYNSLVQQSKP